MYRYVEAWELEPEKLNLDSGSLILDLRKPSDFTKWHFPAAANVPLESVDSKTPSPFFDPEILEKVWKELESLFSGKKFNELAEKDVTVVCYDGDVSRVATSVLRNKGANASSIKNGIRGLEGKLSALTSRGEHLENPPIHFAGYEEKPLAKLEAFVSVATV